MPFWLYDYVWKFYSTLNFAGGFKLRVESSSLQWFWELRIYHFTLTSSKNTWVFLRMCFNSVSSKKLRLRASAFWFTSLNSFSSFSKVACRRNKKWMIIHFDRNFFKCRKIKLIHLEIYHFSGLRSFRILSSVQHRDSIFFNFFFQVTKLSLHFIATSDFVDEFPLKGVHVRIKLKIQKLNFSVELITIK